MPQTDATSKPTPPYLLYAWQERTHEQLGVFLADGRRLELPPLLWTIATNGNLVGEADGLSYTPDQQRQAIRQWARYLRVEVDTEHTTDGREELYAGWRDEDRLTRGCFRATIFVHREGA